MSQVCTIGLDIAKNKFQVHGEDRHGKKVFNRQLLRKEVLPFFANLPACLIGIEACGGALTGRESLANWDMKYGSFLPGR